MLGLGLTDETFAVHITAFQNGWQRSLTTLFVCNHTAQLGWVSGAAIGAFCGELVSDVKPLGLDYALTAMFLALLVPQCVSRLHVLVALFTTVLSISLKAAGMTQWNIAVATVLGASLGTWLMLRKARCEGTPCDFAASTPAPASNSATSLSTTCTEEAES